MVQFCYWRLSYDTKTGLSSVDADGKDGNGVNLEKIGPISSRFDAISSKITRIVIMVSSPW